MGVAADNIELILPFKAEYVSIVRLTVSGVANRIGFDIEAIEDIKVAVAEVCNKLVTAGSNTAENKSVRNYRVVFRIYDKALTVIFDCEDKSLKYVFSCENDELGVSIINALMDSVEVCANDSFLLSMTKALEENC